MEVNDSPRPDGPRDARGGLRRQRLLRTAARLNAVAAILLALVLAVMANYLSIRHYRRMDWTRTRYYSLSQRTLDLLGSLTNDIRVIVFFQPEHQVYTDVENLLREYEYASSRIRAEYVDPARDLARTEELAQKYQVGEANVVVFDSGARSKYVGLDDMVEFAYPGMEEGRIPEAVAFKGEQAFSSAIQDISQSHSPVVYFLEGHGERSVEDFDQRRGYSSLARMIRRDNITVKTVRFGEMTALPEDTDALVIAGPARRFAQPEIDLIGTHLAHNGRLILMLDKDVRTGLAPLLEEWGIRVGNDVVTDPARTLTGDDLFITEYGEHPITAQMKGLTTIFYQPRSVSPAAGTGGAGDPSDKPRVVSLASCSADGWAETRPGDGLFQFDPLEDRRGPVPVAVAMERGAAPALDVRIRPTRAVVFGDSDFVCNGAMAGGGLDFFMSALNWVLEREELLAIAPKTIVESRLILNRHDLRELFWILVPGLPLAVALAGLLVWLRRRRGA